MLKILKAICFLLNSVVNRNKQSNIIKKLYKNVFLYPTNDQIFYVNLGAIKFQNKNPIARKRFPCYTTRRDARRDETIYNKTLKGDSKIKKKVKRNV
jgi:hypothetical protein